VFSCTDLLISIGIFDFEDTKGVNRNRKSKNNKQYNGQNKDEKRTKHYTEQSDPAKHGGARKFHGRVSRSCSRDSGIRRVTLVTNPEISHE